MWNDNSECTIIPPYKGFLTPPPASNFNPLYPSVTSMTECRRNHPQNRVDSFHVIHKVPAGDSPYVRAKHVQLIEKDPSRAISLFWSAINSGDRVDSALKDMAVVMKQLNRSDEAIEAIKSFRHLCPPESQESIDNVLVELYKRAGRIEEEIEMLQIKLKRLEEGSAFGGRRTKTARSQGKKVHITVEQERSRILGNLAWAYLQQNNYTTAEEFYRKALSLEQDMNKQCNLAICLMHTNRLQEAKSLLYAVKALSGKNPMDESYAKSYDRALETLTELEKESELKSNQKDGNSSKEMSRSLSSSMTSSMEDVNSSINTSRLHHHVFENVVPREVCVGGNHLENKANFNVYEINNSHCTSMTARSGIKISRPIVPVDKWKKDYSESSSESKPVVITIMKNRVGTVGTDPSSLNKKTYFSPAPARCNQRTPYTQPRRCLWGFSDEEQRRVEEVWGKDVTGNSRKNCSYNDGNSRKNCNNDNGNSRKNCSYDNGNSRKNCSYDGNSKKSCSYDDGNSKKNCSCDEDRRRKSSWQNGDMKRCNQEEEYLNVSMIAAESPNDFCNTKALGSSISTFGEGSSGRVENSCQQPTETSKPSVDSSVCNNKKSWADMAEEEDDEHCYITDEFCCDWSGEEAYNNENMNSNLIHGSPCLQTQMKNPSQKLEIFHGNWYSEDELKGKSDTSNMIPGTSYLQSQMKRLTRKLEFCEVRDEGNNSKQGNVAVSSGNPTARRTLCFDQKNQKGVSTTDCFSSAAASKNVQKFDRNSNSGQHKGRSSVKKTKRNRLKVFQDITHHPDSP
ncbi:hypothetical protein F8388_022652 [Cannabis sativa]|uniref:Uncharacterized protein n=1 Tax=Cannabis sativa TaxID=3483 RepID=A0A7J6G1U4_CANSA|nr:hypothetical protein F8388_022652 [Cannabis sativa]